jgi:WD40 repeat protein
MSERRRHFSLVTVLLLAASPLGCSSRPAADRSAGELPTYALARLGTLPFANGRLQAADTGKELEPLPTGSIPITTVACSADGRLVLTAGSLDGYGPLDIRFWEPRTGKELVQKRFRTAMWTVLALSPDGNMLALGEDKSICLRDVVTGKQIRRLDGEYDAVRSLVFSQDGKLLAAGARSHSLRVWDVPSGKQLCDFPNSNSGMEECLGFSPDGKTLLSRVENCEVHIWEIATSKRMPGLNLCAHHNLNQMYRDRNRPHHPEDSIFEIVLSPGGNLFACGGKRGTGTWLWNVDTGTEIRWLDSYQGIIRELARDCFWDRPLGFSPDCRSLVIALNDKGFSLVELATGKERRRFEGHQRAVMAAAFSADGRTLVTGSLDTTAVVWDVLSLAGTDSAPTDRLTSDQLDSMWAALASDDVPKAFQAICRLVAAHGQALPYLEEHLRPAPRPDKPVARLIADLDTDEFAVRDKATKQLAALGKEAEPALRQAQKESSSAEVRRRVEELLRRLEESKDGPLSPERLRELRAVEVLEYIGTPEARRLLESLAKGPEGILVTEEARASLDRLARRPMP